MTLGGDASSETSEGVAWDRRYAATSEPQPEALSTAPEALVSTLADNTTNARWNAFVPVGTPHVVTYSFMDSLPADLSNFSYPGFQSMWSTQRDSVRRALDAWSAVSGLSFVEVSQADGGGQVRFGLHQFTGFLANAEAYAFRPGILPGTGYISNIGGDVWLKQQTYGSDALDSGLGFFVLLHEIGHAIGFKHPFQGYPTLSWADDSTVNTVMSYTGDAQSVLGPIDIAAVRYLYGSSKRPFGWDPVSKTLGTYGSDADEYFQGIEFSDNVVAGGGADTVYALDGRDWVSGMDGADLVYGGTGDDTVWGGADADWIEGADGSDYLLGDGGNDALVGDGERDWLYGYDDGDAIRGGAGDDDLRGGDGGDWIDGGIGSDYLLGERGNDALLGQEGRDWLYGDDANDTLRGGLGDDDLYGEAGDDWLDGETGDDVLVGHGGNDVLVGQDRHDWLYGEDGNDVIYAGAGDDVLSGWTGNDWLDGDVGSNRFYGGDGNDTILASGNMSNFAYGGAGQDVTILAGSLDWLQGETGDDWLQGGGADDTLFGGAGADVLVGENGSDTVYGGDGGDTIRGGGLVPAPDPTGADVLSGEAGNDIIIGAAGPDAIWGGDGDDLIHTDDGSTGGSGGNVVRSEAGTDTIVLGNGAADSGFSDRVSYASRLELGFAGYNVKGSDTIMGFAPKSRHGANPSGRSDKIDVAGLLLDLENALGVDYYGQDPFAAGRMLLEAAGSDTLVKIYAPLLDDSGTIVSGMAWHTLCRLANVLPGELSTANSPNRDWTSFTAADGDFIWL